MPEHRIIHYNQSSFEYEFSICTLVTSWEEYAIMKESFIVCGFNDNCQYLVVDNVGTNNYDAYQAIAAFLQESRAKYIILVHQDVRCIDNRAALLTCLEKLHQLDAKWALCGNAGAFGYHNDMIHITNNGKIVKSADLPTKANSLDENFLVINGSKRMAVSSDINGFHLYGTDLAIIADILGHTSYVIPFMVKHLSLGNLKELMKNVPTFTDLYGRKLRNRYIQTPCTKFYLSSSVGCNRFYNMPFIFFFVKAVQRFKRLGMLIREGVKFKKDIQFESGYD